MPATTIAKATVFDGTQFLSNSSVRFDDVAIRAVGRDVAPEPDDDVIDGRGHTLLPGLIDAHVHTPRLPDPAVRTLRDALRFGVTTAVDLGADPAIVATMKARTAVAPGLPDLRSAGVLATVPGGHPLELGGELPTID